jgi:uncharacterized protein with FMN-binding domain
MKKFILSLFVIASFGFYVVSQNAGISVNNIIAPTTTTTSTPTVAVKKTKKATKPVAVVPTNPVVPTDPVIPIVLPSPQPVISPPKKVGIYNDGTYVGDSVDAYYGNIQVKAVITNGQLADVVFLDYPQDRGTSVRINSRAMPILKSEAIQAQNSNVNTVSGATDSSGAFRQSLASALSQARA